MTEILSCEALCCRRENWQEARPSMVENITLSFQAKTVNVFTGHEGSGKGLLLNLLGLLEPADSGTITVAGTPVASLASEEVARLRNDLFGFLFDSPCLLPSFSVAENVAIPLFRIRRLDATQARDRTIEVLTFCGIAHLADRLAGRLDSPSQWLAAFARAIVHHPQVLIAVSPRDGCALCAPARAAADRLGLCVLWACPDDQPPPAAERLIALAKGRITESS